ncbi:DUF4181 domain-containing protein [Metabacillus litoralis]|uniref:DUF4181 domain-containing protein n=1 Tax=Metabacillus litoralis TaxID=152268 RepID=A0A5C6VLE3_9BACI|nr:DUF4181 domain-containing protein [Metabacillus litoralis]
MGIFYILVDLFIGIVNNSFRLTWLYLIALSFNRGLQEWRYDRKHKEYILSWFRSAQLLLSLFLFTIYFNIKNVIQNKSVYI